jgi:hypothetical protein
MSHKAFAVLVCIAACDRHVPEVRQLPVESGPKVRAKQAVEAIFGRVDDQGRWMQLRELRFGSGKAFGWRIRLPCRQPIEYREVMKLPSRGDFNLEDQRESVVSPDGLSMTTHDFAACIDGWIEHSWALSEHDPKGRWEITVTIAGYAPFVFTPTFAE